MWSFISLKYSFFCCSLYWSSHPSFGSPCSKWLSAAIITSRSLLIWAFSMLAFMNAEKPPSFVSLWAWYAMGFSSSCGASHFYYDNLSLDYFLSSFTEVESFSMLPSSYPHQSCPCSVLFIYCLTSCGKKGNLGDVTQCRRVSYCLCTATGCSVPVL